MFYIVAVGGIDGLDLLDYLAIKVEETGVQMGGEDTFAQVHR